MGPGRYSHGEMLAEPNDRAGTAGAGVRTPNRLQVAVIDRDPGFMLVLGKRLDALGSDHRVLSSAVTPEALMTMRLNALVLDPAIVGPNAWEYLERICSR